MQQSFEYIIRIICALADFNIVKLEDRNAILGFPMKSGRVRIVCITQLDSTVEFMVPTAPVYDSFDDVPHQISSLLLRQNAQYEIGRWSLEKSENNFIFSIAHNVSMEDFTNPHYFVKLIQFLLSESQRFENSLNSASYSSNQSEFDWGHLFQVGVEALLQSVIEGEINSLYDQ